MSIHLKVCSLIAYPEDSWPETHRWLELQAKKIVVLHRYVAVSFQGLLLLVRVTEPWGQEKHKGQIHPI